MLRPQLPAAMASDGVDDDVSNRSSTFDTADDRESLTAEDRTVLIIEDDPVFASLLAELARERQFKVLTAASGADGLALARHYRPSAILLDIGLPDMDGLAVIGRLKGDLDVRHIPVHVISAHERNLDALKSGAVGYLRKPVNPAALSGMFSHIEQLIERPVRRLLVAVSDPDERSQVTAAVGGADVELTAVDSGEQALRRIREGSFDCAVIQWELPGMTGKEVLLDVRQTPGISNLPIIILSNTRLSREETVTIDRYADRHVTRDERATARLLDDTALFLHRVEAALPADQKRIIRMLHDRESLFRERKLLLVDDDMRNVFALCSLLEGEGLQIEVARDGVEALVKLDHHPDTDLMLMDIMMPRMDGYEAMRRIRADGRFDKLPIIALTAKAMRGDRAQCIEAGASDYLTKPVDDDKLLSMLRVWLFR